MVGPNANATTVLLSNYEGIQAFITTIYQGLSSSGMKVEYASGCFDVKCSDKQYFSKALDIVADADYVIAVIGLDTVESDGHDRANTTCESQPVDNIAL